MGLRETLIFLSSCVILLSGCSSSKTLKKTETEKNVAENNIKVSNPTSSVVVSNSNGLSVAVIKKQMDEQKQEITQTLSNVVVKSIEEGEALKVIFDSDVFFVSNSSTLKPESKEVLCKFAKTLQKNAQAYLYIIGYTDNTGNIDYNQILSEKRAKSIYHFLLKENVVLEKMFFQGRGIHDPIANNSTPEGRYLNRRIEVLISAREEIKYKNEQLN